MKNRTAFECTVRRTRGDYAVFVSKMEIASCAQEFYLRHYYRMKYYGGFI